MRLCVLKSIVNHINIKLTLYELNLRQNGKKKQNYELQEEMNVFHTQSGKACLFLSPLTAQSMTKHPGPIQET